jgi:hypothetical protein
MNLFKKKPEEEEDERFEEFLSEIKKRSFVIKLKKKDEEGKTISSGECDVIKLSTLNKLIATHFGYSMKNSKPFNREH